MRATEFAEDNFGTNPRRAPRPGARPNRGHEPIPQYRSMREHSGTELHVGDPVIITGNVEYQGKTGDVRQVGQNGAFVVVDLYNYGPHSFHASDVSYNDYADSEDELNEFALDDDGDDPTEDYPCYDCGSTIFLHHTKLCDLAEPNANRDLPAKPGTQYWTGQVPKGLAPIPGLAEGVTETNVAKYADMGANDNTTHFIKNMTTGKIVSPHRSLQDAQDALVGNERGSNDKFKIVRARKSSVAEGSSFPGPLSNRDVATIGQLQRSTRGRGSEVTAPHQRSDWFDADSPVGAKKQKLAYLKAKKQGVAEQDRVGNMPADKFDDAMARLKQLAGAGPLKTVWDPQKRVYKNVPTAVQPKK